MYMLLAESERYELLFLIWLIRTDTKQRVLQQGVYGINTKISRPKTVVLFYYVLHDVFPISSEV